MCCVAACMDAPPSDDSGSVTGGVVTGTSTTTATIEYTLPADGCAFVVHIKEAAYAPDAATLGTIREKVTHYGMSTFQVRYKLTGRTGRVECGFNTHRDLPEVALVLVGS